MSKKRQQQRSIPTSAPASGIANLSAAQRQQIVEAQISASFSGPLPHPDLLARYNLAVPTGAERVIAMAEKQSAHRIALENRVVDADIRRANWGLVAGFIVALAFGAGSFILILSGYALVGGIIGGGDLVALVGTFVYGTQSRRSERRERLRILTGRPEE